MSLKRVRLDPKTDASVHARACAEIGIVIESRKQERRQLHDRANATRAAAQTVDPDDDLAIKAIDGISACAGVQDIVAYCSSGKPALAFTTERILGAVDLLQPRRPDDVAAWATGDRCKEIKHAEREPRKEVAGALLSTGWQTAAIRGVAAFVQKRARAEALSWLTDRLRHDLCGASGDTLFAATCRLLKNERAEAAITEWATIKAAIERDLREFPTRFLASVIPETARNGTWLGLMVATEVFQRVQRGESIAEVLAGLSTLTLTVGGKEPSEPLRDQVALVRTLGFAVRVAGDPSERGAMEEAVFVTFAGGAFLSALAADAKEAYCSDASAGKLSCEEFAGRKILALRRTLESLADAASNLGTGEQEQQSLAYSNFLRAFVPVFEALADVWASGAGAELKAAAESTQHVVDAIDSARRRDYPGLVVATLAYLDTTGVVEEESLPAWFHRFLSFSVDVAAAETAEDFERVLSAAAAPVASYKAKRGSPKWDLPRQQKKDIKARRSLVVNGYVGVMGGGDFLVDGRVDDPAPAGTVALFAPIGIEYARGVGNHASIGLFAPIFDVGGLVDYRVGPTATPSVDVDAANAAMEGEVQEAPNVTFAQVVSPGLFALVGIPKVPLTIGAGFVYVPKLRKVVAGSRTLEVPAVQVGAFFAVDIPIFFLTRR